MRGKLGGLLGLQGDFDIVDKTLQRGERIGENEAKERARQSFRYSSLLLGELGGLLTSLIPFILGGLLGRERIGEIESIKRTRVSFQSILKAIQLSWGRFFRGEREFQFQICGRLSNLRGKDVIVDAIVSSFEAHTSKPYLKPVTSFFPELNSAQINEIRISDSCFCVGSSPRGRYFAFGVPNSIAVANASTGEVFKLLHVTMGLSDAYASLVNRKNLLLGLLTKTVAVWEWEKSDSAAMVLKGHDGCVRGVAVDRNCERIISGSEDGTLRIWSGKTGLEIEKLEQGSGVRCVALCADGRKVATGLENGNFKVLDCSTGEAVFQHVDEHDSVKSVAFSPDGQRLATGAWTIRIWDTETWAANWLTDRST